MMREGGLQQVVETIMEERMGSQEGRQECQNICFMLNLR